jgi:hypothetical protein
MRNSMQGSQSRENQNAAATTRWIANATVALLPVLACFLGGATQKWEEGLVITLLALCLLVRPPQFSPDWSRGEPQIRRDSRIDNC